MISYFIPFIILTLLTSFEYSKKFDFLVRNKFLYFLVFLFFIIFRDEIGCDWDQYKGCLKNIIH